MAELGASDLGTHDSVPCLLPVGGRLDTPPPFTSCSRAFVAEFEFLRRALLRHGVPASDVDDAAQDVFLVMWRRWSEYDSTRPLRPWLAGIAFNLAQHRRQRREVPVAEPTPPGEAPDPEEQLFASRARALLLSTIATLPDKFREPIVMHDLDGRTITELAREMHVSVATASARVQAARRACAKALRRRQTTGEGRSAERALGLLFSLPGPRLDEPARLPLWLAGAAAVLAGALAIGTARGHARSARAAEVAPPLKESLAAVSWRRARTVRPEPPAPSRGAALDEGVIGDWRFDEATTSAIAVDRSPSANDCVLHDLGAAAHIDGHRGRGLHLGGSGWLECPRADAVTRLDREMTVAAWIRPVSAWGAQTIAARQQDHGHPDQFFFGLVNGRLDVTSRTFRKTVDAELPAAHGRWIHVAFTRRADGLVALYADGTRIGQGKSRPSFALGGGKGALTIGGSINGRDRAKADELFGGDLDEVVIYDRALSDAEVAALAGLRSE